MNARNCSSTRPTIRCCTIRSTYSCLFSSVTGALLPPGSRSMVTSSPRGSSMVLNASSSTSVMTFPLQSDQVNECRTNPADQQRPYHVLNVHGCQVFQSHLLAKDHLVDTWNKA